MTVWERWVGQPQTLWLRRALFQVHMWSGLGVGLYILVISLSGSVLVYRSELRQVFNPEPRIVVPSGDRLSTDALTEAARQIYPDHQVRVFAEPEDLAHAVTMSVNRDGAVAQMHFDPYTGEELGHALPFGWRATTWLLDLHDNLLTGETGRSVNGGGAVALTLLSLTGAMIWWPGIRSWSRSLVVDRARRLATAQLESSQRHGLLDRRLHHHVGYHRRVPMFSPAVHGGRRLSRAPRSRHV